MERSSGYNGTNDEVIFYKGSDTSFVDTGINTRDSVYNYHINFFNADDNLIDSTATTSTLRLDITNQISSIQLNWQYNVPWLNKIERYPYHYIYRNRTDDRVDNIVVFRLIDSVKVTDAPLSFNDVGDYKNLGLKDNLDYWYYVVTSGAYTNNTFNRN